VRQCSQKEASAYRGMGSLYRRSLQRCYFRFARAAVGRSGAPSKTNRGDALGAAFGRLTTPSHILAARGALAIQTYSIAPAVYSATD
jgi:hypothetical protein